MKYSKRGLAQGHASKRQSNQFCSSGLVPFPPEGFRHRGAATGATGALNATLLLQTKCRGSAPSRAAGTDKQAQGCAGEGLNPSRACPRASGHGRRSPFWRVPFMARCTCTPKCDPRTHVALHSIGLACIRCGHSQIISQQANGVQC